MRAGHALVIFMGGAGHFKCDMLMMEWYYGELTKEEAARALKASAADCFLVRQRKRGQGSALSYIQKGVVYHTKIEECSGGECRLEGLSKPTFSSLQDLVGYYRSTPISDKLHSLGAVCERIPKNG